MLASTEITGVLHTKQTTSKSLPYSTGKYIQYLVITYNGKESEKEHTHTRITLRNSTSTHSSNANHGQEQFLICTYEGLTSIYEPILPASPSSQAVLWLPALLFTQTTKSEHKDRLRFLVLSPFASTLTPLFLLSKPLKSI